MATIVGTPGDDHLYGTPEDDVIWGGRGQDYIFGRGGDDLICGGPAPVRFKDGDPIIQGLHGGPGRDVLIGGRGPEGLSGDQGSDVLRGHEGQDFLLGDSGGQRGAFDVLRGGPGPDYLDGDLGPDQLWGQEGGDRFEDHRGNNRMHGGPGRDFLKSGPGNESLNGGRGIDAVSYEMLLQDNGSSSHCKNITVDLNAGVATGAGFGADTLSRVENVATGGGNDVLVGDAGPNTFATGYPYPCRASHEESVTGGGGRDHIAFESDKLMSGSAAGPVIVDLAAGIAEQVDLFSGLRIVLLTLDSIENVTGTSDADVIRGDDGPNRLIGYASPEFGDGDVIYGQGGPDSLWGSGGADELYGEDGSDVLRGQGGNDLIDGGADLNVIDGGRGQDTCQNPDRFSGATNCEL